LRRSRVFIVHCVGGGRTQSATGISGMLGTLLNITVTDVRGRLNETSSDISEVLLAVSNGYSRGAEHSQQRRNERDTRIV
jgi:hypothetical protein